MSKIPENLRYTKDHEWVRLENGKAYVGITDHAQSALGEIVYVELPSVGDHFSQGDEIAEIESVKAASAIVNPLEGTVSAVNEELDDSPESVNSDCYGQHLYVLGDIADDAGGSLLDAAGYQAFLKTL